MYAGMTTFGLGKMFKWKIPLQNLEIFIEKSALSFQFSIQCHEIVICVFVCNSGKIRYNTLVHTIKYERWVFHPFLKE